MNPIPQGGTLAVGFIHPLGQIIFKPVWSRLVRVVEVIIRTLKLKLLIIKIFSIFINIIRL